MSSFGRIVEIGLISYDACGVHANERLCRENDDARAHTLLHTDILVLHSYTPVELNSESYLAK